MKKLINKRTPQWVIMLDLLMMLLFILISVNEEKGVKISFDKYGLPKGSLLINVKNETEIMHYDFLKNIWINSIGKIDKNKFMFVDCKECIKLLPKKERKNIGYTTIAIGGKVKEKVNNKISENLLKGQHTFNIFIDYNGNVKIK